MCERVCECARSKAGYSSLNLVQFWSKLSKKRLQNHDFAAENTGKQHSPGAIHYLHFTQFPGTYNQPQDLVLPAIERARLPLSFAPILSFWEQNLTEKTAFEVEAKRDRLKRARNVQKSRLGHPRRGFFQLRGVGGCKGVGTCVWVAHG